MWLCPLALRAPPLRLHKPIWATVGGGEGGRMRQPEAAMRLLILLQRPLSRGHRGQVASASPPMFFNTVLMTSWHTTFSCSIVCHARLWTTTCDNGAH